MNCMDYEYFFALLVGTQIRSGLSGHWSAAQYLFAHLVAAQTNETTKETATIQANDAALEQAALFFLVGAVATGAWTGAAAGAGAEGASAARLLGHLRAIVRPLRAWRGRAVLFNCCCSKVEMQW
jgi:hypothetical protein